MSYSRQDDGNENVIEGGVGPAKTDVLFLSVRVQSSRRKDVRRRTLTGIRTKGVGRKRRRK